jgi:hypothetical protein
MHKIIIWDEMYSASSNTEELLLLFLSLMKAVCLETCIFLRLRRIKDFLKKDYAAKNCLLIREGAPH